MARHRASPARAAVDHSFEELYRGHHRDVFRVVLRDLGNVHDAEDVTQAAFLDAYRAVLRGSEPQSPRAWLLAIAENVRRRRFRTAQRRPREEPLGSELPPAAEPPEELAQALADALAALPADQRRVFLLREVAGLSYDEIAERVGATVASIQMLLFRARRSLRAELEPPTVSRRRAGLLLPLPDWLTNPLARFEAAAVAPRAVGALGATVITVVGAGVAVGPPPVEATPKPLVRQAPEPAAPQLPARVVTRPTQGKPAGVSAAGPTGLTVSQGSRSVTVTEPVEVAAEPAAAPAAAPTQSPASSPAPVATPVSEPAAAVPVPVQAPALPEPERPGLPLPVENVEVPGPLELPLPPPPSTAHIEEATGAEGAAGASAPPLPVPSLPLESLPPA